MISSVYMSGRAGDFDKKFPDVRYIEVDHIMPTEKNYCKTDKIPVLIPYQGSNFLTAKTGNICVIKGRIEMYKDFGLLVVEEMSEAYSSRLK